MKTILLALLGTVLASPQAVLPTGWQLRPAGQQIQLEDFPMSSLLSRDGKTLFVLHSGKTPSITVFDTASWKQITRLTIPDGWLGMALSQDQKLLWAGGGSRGSILEFSWSGTELKPTREMGLATATSLAPVDFIGDVKLSPDGRLLYAAEVFRDSVAVINPQSGRLIERFKTGRRPYRIVFHPDGKSFFVTSWSEGSLYQHETANGAELGRLRLGPGTTDMVLSSRKIPEDESGAKFRLFLTSSSANNVFVVGVNESREMKQQEVLNIGTAAAQPAGMTPSALALSTDQTQLFVACSDANAVAVLDISEGRSRIAGFIPSGAYPTSAASLPDGRLAILNAASGSMSIVPAADEGALARHTQAVMESTPYRAEMADEVATSRSVFKNVVYILTDRAVEGPNQAALSREFVRFDNFQLAGNTLAENHLWATAAIAPAFARRLLPARAAGRLKFANFAGGELANLPPAGYLWSNARAAGLTVRNYGEFVENDRVTDPALSAITNLAFKGTDEQRVSVLIEEWKQRAAQPQLNIVHLAGDDAPLGRLVEFLSGSSVWNETVVFVAGTSGTNGKSTLLAISPYSRRAAVDATPYNSASVLRTIELVLGLRPMTQFDSAARRLTNAFGTKLDLTPFKNTP